MMMQCLSSYQVPVIKRTVIVVAQSEFKKLLESKTLEPTPELGRVHAGGDGKTTEVG